jgi:hypothetical protein
MGPAAVGPGSVRVPVPTRRRGPQPCCSRGAATCDSSEGPNVPDHHRERSFVRRPVKEVQKGPDAVSSNLSDDDGGWSGAKRDFVADCRDKMADGRDAIADTREAPADMREEEHDRRERTRGPTPSGSHRSSPRPSSNGKPAGRRASTPGKNGVQRAR